jgi:phenylpropionate dioxygenase-like ring-hydroxylating dioxygenase large terminal subunit
MLKETTWWWPVALADELGAEPQGVRLLDQPLVLWREAQGHPVAMVDRCPHRGAQLSMGRVLNGHLQCPYHGWRFEASGRCVGIPAQPGFTPPVSSSVCRYPVAEHEGLIWVALVADKGQSPGSVMAERLALPDLSHLPSRRLIYGPFDVATSAPRAVENFLDTSHFAFVHEGWLGAADHPEVPPYEVTHTTDGRPVIEAYKAWQPRASAAAAGGDWVTYRYEVLSPYSALLSKQGDAGGPQDSYTIWACPTTPDSCRLWFAQYTTDAVSSDDVLRDFQVEIFSQDQPVLESQQPKRLPLSGGEAHSAADRLSAAYRRYLQACGITFGVC